MIEDEPVMHEQAEIKVPDVQEEMGSPQHQVFSSELSEDDIKSIIEAAVFASNKPVSMDKLSALFADSVVNLREKVKSALDALTSEYQSRGVELVEVGSGFRFQVAQKSASWVSRLWEEKPQKYSRALLETLALIAYRQPVTRGEIEEIRGVSVSSNIMRTLVEREWVRVVGHRDVPGKPGIYATTRQFLDYFGLKRLDELPTLAEIRDFDMINKELDFGEPGDEVNDNGNITGPEMAAENEQASENEQTALIVSEDSHEELQHEFHEEPHDELYDKTSRQQSEEADGTSD